MPIVQTLSLLCSSIEFNYFYAVLIASLLFIGFFKILGR